MLIGGIPFYMFKTIRQSVAITGATRFERRYSLRLVNFRFAACRIWLPSPMTPLRVVLAEVTCGNIGLAPHD